MTDIPPFTTSNVAVSNIAATSVMVIIDGSGHVKIDWNEVEKQADGKDGYLRPLAIALLAVRDKKWEPIKP